MTAIRPAPPTLDELKELIVELDEIERARQVLYDRRAAMIRELRSHYVSARKIGNVTGLSLSGVYKIQKETHV
jgi:hypothetical protein